MELGYIFSTNNLDNNFAGFVGQHTMWRVILHSDGTVRCWNNSPVTIVKHVKYRECCRNLACRIGGHIVDRCSEFVAYGAEGTSAAMTCATCGCHRNFHRKEEQIQLVCTCSSHPTTGTGGGA
ncbi:Mini zinc finger protein 2 [Glycine max]|nr:Mini zinc finger protein 2 [Glycine max]